MNFKISLHPILSLECIPPRLYWLLVLCLKVTWNHYFLSVIIKFGMYLGPFVYHFRVASSFFFFNLLLPFEYIWYIAQKEKLNVMVHVEILFSSSSLLFPPCFPIDNHFCKFLMNHSSFFFFLSKLGVCVYSPFIHQG